MAYPIPHDRSTGDSELRKHSHWIVATNSAPTSYNTKIGRKNIKLIDEDTWIEAGLYN
jgi:hypothetical protein